jgi:hypothetical protein
MSDTYEATALFLRQRVLILQARLAEAERDAARYRFIKQWARRLDITGYSLTNNEHFEPRIDEAMAIASQPSSADVERRPCTCHPDDNPPVPCPRMYALQDCRRAAALAAEIESLRSRLLDAKEQVAALESREVCTVAHDNVETCGYCQRDELLAERALIVARAENAERGLVEAEQILSACYSPVRLIAEGGSRTRADLDLAAETFAALKRYMKPEAARLDAHLSRKP